MSSSLSSIAPWRRVACAHAGVGQHRRGTAGASARRAHVSWSLERPPAHSGVTVRLRYRHVGTNEKSSVTDATPIIFRAFPAFWCVYRGSL